MVGVSSSFTGGCVEAVSSLANMAYAAENYEVVGRYAQAVCVVCEVPTIPFWGLAMRM